MFSRVHASVLLDPSFLLSFFFHLYILLPLSVATLETSYQNYPPGRYKRNNACLVSSLGPGSVRAFTSIHCPGKAPCLPLSTPKLTFFATRSRTHRHQLASLPHNWRYEIRLKPDVAKSSASTVAATFVTCGHPWHVHRGSCQR